MINELKIVKAYEVNGKLFSDQKDAIRELYRVDYAQSLKDTVRNHLRRLEFELKRDLETIKSNKYKNKRELYELKARYYSNKIKLYEYIEKYKEARTKYRNALMNQKLNLSQYFSNTQNS